MEATRLLQKAADDKARLQHSTPSFAELSVMTRHDHATWRAGRHSHKTRRACSACPCAEARRLANSIGDSQPMSFKGGSPPPDANKK